MVRGLTKQVGAICALVLLSLSFSASQGMAQSSFFSSARSYSSSSVQSSSIQIPVRPTAKSRMASGWKKGHKSRTRIIAGDSNFSASRTTYAGVHLQIAPGWKTYWRSPGDVGVPPSFDWSGSRNLKNIRIKWPAPKAYKDAYSTSIGYKHEVILPLEITAKDKSKPVDVKLRFAYGICADICVPVETKLKLTIPTRQSGFKTLLSRYQSRVPKSVKSTGKVINGFSIRKVTVNLKGKRPRITIDASVPDHTKKAELFAEASNGFYLPLPIGERPSAGNRRRFHIDLTKSDPVQQLRGKILALTLVGDKAGIEYKLKIN
ncbi:MAG: hypothetical protein L3J67_07895 [Hyphomicrobiaceae bacterium]|nr:hypothetical protein [Hyphomicrobiaceae bacterium]